MKPLQHKKHTLAKRGLSLLCVLALCLGLLPVTALAANGIELYVGGQLITESGCYANQNGTWTKVEGSDGTEPANGQFYYDAATFTLTLNKAEITHDQTVNVAEGYTYYGSVIAFSQTADVSLKIVVSQGTSNITGKGGIRVESTTGNASLSIAGPGSLDVKPIGSNSGITLCSSKNRNLDIDGADVTALSPALYGVYLFSSTDASSTSTITVNNGSLTTGGNGNVGIYYYWSDKNNAGTSSLTVSGNAVVDTRNSKIQTNNEETVVQVGAGSDGNGGIVFDGKSGTVYGDVTLQEDLAIGTDETLTIGKDASLTVPDGKTLTNNGTIDNGGTLTNSGTVTNNGTIVNKGTMNGDPTGGTGKIETTPTIDTQPASQFVTEGEDATFTVAASGENLSYQWQQRTNSGSDWTNVVSETSSNTYTIDNTTTSMSGYQYRCVVSNSAGSVTSEVATLTVNEPAPTTYTITADVTPSGAGTATSDKTKATAGDTVKLTATANSGYRFTGWTFSDNITDADSSSANTTFTMPAGDVTVTANFEQYYTITVNASAGGTVDGGGDYAAGSSVTLKATANSGYRFVAWMENDQQVSDDAVYTFTANGNRTLTARFEKVYNVTVNSTAGGTAAADKTTAGVGETVSLTANPNSGYRFTGWTFSDNITGADVSSKTTSFTMPAGDVTATANFAKISSVTPSIPPTVSEKTIDAIQDAEPGETVTVDLSSGSTKLDKEVFETLAGKNVTLVVDLGDGVSWTVKGSDIPEDATLTDIDMGVTMNSDGIPVDVVNAITGEHGSVQLELAHNGAFGFTMTLTAPVGAENAGYWANLYHYDEDAEALNFEAAAKIDEDGSVKIPFSHASQYAIVIDTHSHATVDVSDLFIDVAPNAWYKDAVQYAYDNGLMTGVSATEFDPEATTTRAMIVSILARLEGVESAQAAGFADVDDEWYATAVNWAANVGVVNGYEDNTFQPNTAITREQLAAILMNYAAYKGEDVSNRADLANYTDQPSTWATETMSWAVAEGLISGVTNDELQPQSSATRAQVAAILQRFLAQ